MTRAISVFGNFTIDDLIFPDGSTRWAVPGGSSVYSALGISLWTGSAIIVAPVGDDYPVDLLDSRVDLSRCRRIPRTLRNWGLYEEDGKRHFVSRNASRNWSEFSPIREDALSGHQDAAHIAPLPHLVARGLVEELREAGVLHISLDLDDHDLLGRSNFREVIELVRGVDLFLPSEQDVAAMFPGLEPIEALHELRVSAPDIGLIAIKCGARGVIAHVAGAQKWVHVPAVPVVPVDTTGAGDAFCGGVLAGFCKEKDPLEALLYGTVSASFCVETLGFIGLTTAAGEEANARLSALRRHVESNPEI